MRIKHWCLESLRLWPSSLCWEAGSRASDPGFVTLQVLVPLFHAASDPSANAKSGDTDHRCHLCPVLLQCGRFVASHGNTLPRGGDSREPAMMWSPPVIVSWSASLVQFRWPVPCRRVLRASCLNAAESAQRRPCATQGLKVRGVKGPLQAPGQNHKAELVLLWASSALLGVD